MDNTNWLKQTNKPLFEELIWSKPENQAAAGKLLIVGGHAHSLLAPAAAYQLSIGVGIGSCRVLLPDSTKKLLGKGFSQAEFASSTPSGSFSHQALDSLLDNATWSDGVILAGDFGHNSETAMMLESFTAKHMGQITFSGDSLDYFLEARSPVLSRSNSLIAASFTRMQKLAKNNAPELKITTSMNMHELVLAVSKWSNEIQACLAVPYLGQVVVACKGRVSTTPTAASIEQVAVSAAVWWLQNPNKIFEALTTSLYKPKK